MKETILSNCERNFILRAAHELKRLDGRNLEDFRDLKVHFGQDWGLCYVSLGETKVLTQVTCEIQEPKTTRPNEGLLFINVELSSMAAPHFESGRPSDLSVHINRLLEKCIKDSRAVDLESLCIVAEEKVWVLRVDVNVLNHDGSLVDCASVSALAALAHFKRPDVTTDGEEIKVHNISERDPIPITLHHYPVCVSFALVNNSENIFSDPTAIEERVSDASLTFGINAYKEICCLHLGGTALTKPKIILSCSMKAAARAKEVVEEIKRALGKDAETRKSKKSVGFIHSFEWNKVTAGSKEELKIQLKNFNGQKQNSDIQDGSLEPENDSFEIIDLGNNCAELIKSRKSNGTSNEPNDVPPLKKFIKKHETNRILEKAIESFGEGGSSKWEVDLKTPEADLEMCPEQGVCALPIQPKQIESIDLSGDSEEDVVILTSHDLDNPHSFKNSLQGEKTVEQKNLKKNNQNRRTRGQRKKKEIK